MQPAEKQLDEIYRVRRVNLERIVAQRTHGKLAEIARKSGVHPTGLQRIMRAEAAFTEKTARAIELALKLPIGSLDDMDTQNSYAPVYLMQQVVNLTHEQPLAKMDIGSQFGANAFCLKLTTKMYEPVFPNGSVIVIAPLPHQSPAELTYDEYYLTVSNDGIHVAEIRKFDGKNFVQLQTNDFLPAADFKVLGRCAGVFYAK